MFFRFYAANLAFISEIKLSTLIKNVNQRTSCILASYAFTSSHFYLLCVYASIHSADIASNFATENKNASNI